MQTQLHFLFTETTEMGRPAVTVDPAESIYSILLLARINVQQQTRPTGTMEKICESLTGVTTPRELLLVYDTSQRRGGLLSCNTVHALR